MFSLMRDTIGGLILMAIWVGIATVYISWKLYRLIWWTVSLIFVRPVFYATRKLIEYDNRTASAGL